MPGAVKTPGTLPTKPTPSISNTRVGHDSLRRSKTNATNIEKSAPNSKSHDIPENLLIQRRIYIVFQKQNTIPCLTAYNRVEIIVGVGFKRM